MRFHQARIIGGKHRNFIVDGMQLQVLEDDFEIEQHSIANAITIVRCSIICDALTMEDDPHDSPESTPIYDQLRKEMNNVV